MKHYIYCNGLDNYQNARDKSYKLPTIEEFP